MNKLRVALGDSRVRAALALTAVVGVLTAPTLSGADVVSSAFASETTSLTGYIALGAALVVTLMGIGLGIRMLIKWSRRSVSAA